VGIGLLEAKVNKEQEAKKQGYEKGYGDGYEEAEALYKVTFPCSICGKTLTVMSKKEKDAIKRYMREHGWGHAECINGRY
jgi:flagellar biosynthesis/type III secretory pathway protein FliH